MPDGVIEWFDPATGTGRIAKGGHRFSVSSLDVERAAQVAGARVHFDVDRHRPGEALHVTRRPGRRSRARHHGVGRLTGARHPDDKGPASADPFERPLVDRDVHPEKVVAAWVRHIVAGDVRAAVSLCAPTAVLHTSTDDRTGTSAVSDALEAWPCTGSQVEPIDAVGQGDLGTFRMTWPGWGPDRTAVVHVEHGEIVDASIETAPATRPEAASETAVDVSAAGSVTAQEKRYAVEKVQHLIAGVAVPVLFARVRLRHLGDPAARRPAQAEALLDVNGRAVRAHTAAGLMTEAIDELVDRLWRRVQAQPHWSRTEGVLPEAGEWRHGSRSAPAVGWFERPPDERQLVRRKSFVDDPMSIDDALFDMDLLDYDFFLFNDLASGQDAVVRRTADDHVELSVLHPERIDAPATTRPVAVKPVAPATLTADEAREWLELTEEPMVFFADAPSGRGCVLYRRYDGHYGMIVPVG